MIGARVIPCLLCHGGGLVKTVKFKDPKYVGDPINAVRIFNEKEVDELIFLDVDVTPAGRLPNLRQITEVASEAFMPVCYGGGLRTTAQIAQVLAAGVEKVAINTAFHEAPRLVAEAAAEFGSQSVVVSIDVDRSILGLERVVTKGGRDRVAGDPVGCAQRAEDSGAGEILLTAVHRDGTMSGYDVDLVARVSRAVRIPVIANGGAGSITDLVRGLQAGASAASAGSLFVFHGRHRAVLINYPGEDELRRALESPPVTI